MCANIHTFRRFYFLNLRNVFLNVHIPQIRLPDTLLHWSFFFKYAAEHFFKRGDALQVAVVILS